MTNIKDMTPEEIIAMARTFRQFIEEHAELLDDETALTVPTAFPEWTDGSKYKIGDRVRYDGEFYKVLQEHTSQTDWTPADAPSLFALVLVVEEDEPTEWKQPDSTNAYMSGDIVLFNGVKYMSLINNNVWSPAAYPAGWQRVI
ncbi:MULTISPECIES: carbohydrate-binding protein [unclassified Adlercreutzia]|uniref:carbohydrate-binding protein n=1 Tax=unclassified Adlercreutzia TaxID=2636013 RepID=UPI0013EA22C1|nr:MULTISPECIES: carbohydrate-binding protein [unclassified Adlercreutzia]